MTDLYDIQLSMNDGTEKAFGSFRGKTVLVVNVASKCGFTRQYAGLERLSERYKDSGLVVLGVPCNQFANQEPGSDADIQEFCTRNFGVTFPLTAKTDVNGAGQHPLYAQLTAFPDGGGPIQWNFEKFLISAQGDILARFPSAVDPESAELVEKLEAALPAEAA